MTSRKERINTWYKYVKSNIKPEQEKPEILAGHQAENFLRKIVDKHYRFNGSHSFSAKRVPNRQTGYKNEIDLIVITDKKLYILECKSWSGRLYKKGDKWIQVKRNREQYGKEITHDDVVRKNTEKMNVLLEYLNNKGIKIKQDDCSQKVIFMNPSLAIDSEEIYNNSSVIPADKLDSYLSKQDNKFTRPHRLFSSIINILLDEESSSKIIDGLFKRLGGQNHKKLILEIDSLPTWDKIKLYGTKIESGDIIKSDKSIFKNPKGVPFDKIRKIKVNIVRKKIIFLIKSILNIGRSIGLDLYDENNSLIFKTEANPDGIVKLLPAGSPTPIDISIFNVN